MAKVNEVREMDIDDPTHFLSDQPQVLNQCLAASLVGSDATWIASGIFGTAWNHAMEKRQLPDGPNACHRTYLIGKLGKAVKWADLFSHLCSVKGDSRISLEAEVLITELKTLYDKCISYSCTEHATGIIEEKKALGNVYH